MVNFARSTRQIPVVLASLVLWFSFAWGLPAEPAAAEAEAEAAVEDPWAGVRISDAYDYAKCPRCGKKNEIRAESCSRCGYGLPQPSLEITDPDMVFVPGKGYYREGELLEPGINKQGTYATGVLLIGAGLIMFIAASVRPNWVEVNPIMGDTIVIPPWKWVVYTVACVAGGIGTVLVIKSLPITKEPVYAFESSEPFGPYKNPAYALRSPDSGGLAFEVEVTLLGF
jgi:hypothetical protein